jgi:hypothetical protein
MGVHEKVAEEPDRTLPAAGLEIVAGATVFDVVKV